MRLAPRTAVTVLLAPTLLAAAVVATTGSPADRRPPRP